MNNNQQNSKNNIHNNIDLSIDNLSKAVFIVNKHAKTAPDPKFLYELKKKALDRMIVESKAKKIGLHFSRNPKLSKQTSSVLVSCGEYLFHLPPTKEDFRTLSHLDDLNEQYRNPKTQLSLKQSKAILIAYTGMKEPQLTNPYYSLPSSKLMSPFLKRYGER